MHFVFSRKTLFGLLSLATGLGFVFGRSEAALVRAAKGRDREAFDQLYRAQEASLRRFIKRRVAPSDLEDVLQDTLVAAWVNLPLLDGSERFKTWIFSICYHKIQDYWRRELYHPPNVALRDVEGWAACPPREFDSVVLQESLRAFWEQCTPEQRELLRLYYSDGLTLKEMSDVLGRNLNTLKYQFYRVHDLAYQVLSTDEVTNR